MNTALHFSSEKMDWRTPDVVLDLVRELGPIGLDPASSKQRWTGAKRQYYGTELGDGLKDPWRCFGLVYCNPPYGRELKDWVKKGADEFVIRAQSEDELVMLIPARTDTNWWQMHVLRSDAICFWRGRLKFVGAEHSAPFPSALAYWGARPERFEEVFSKKGWCVRP